MPITEDSVVELSPASGSLRSVIATPKAHRNSDPLVQSSEEKKKETADANVLDASSLMAKLMALSEHDEPDRERQLYSPSRFYQTETGNDVLNIPGFDLDGVDDESIASGQIRVAGVEHVDSADKFE